MPAVIYIFAISAFALGLAEFLPIGLTDIMAADLGVSVESAGRTVTAYALGATVAAPILTALTINWSRKSAMLMTALIFSLGSLVTAMAGHLEVMVAARFVAGLGHGLFLAVASSTAAKLAGASRAGSAVAVVFGGFTLAMAVGVPVTTYLGGVLSWRLMLGLIAVFGAIGFFGLWFGMKDSLKAEQRLSIAQNLKVLFSPVLLGAALVTVFSYAGSFTSYTYIAPLLTQVTGVGAASIGIFMLIYGVAAAIGNIVGGKLTDALGEFKANVMMISGIILTNLAMWFAAENVILMAILTALLGALTFGVVPSLQARLIGIAAKKSPNAQGVAAGLNIAGFNFGIAFGSFSGSLVMAQSSVIATTLAGAALSVIGLALLIMKRK